MGRGHAHTSNNPLVLSPARSIRGFVRFQFAAALRLVCRQRNL